MTSGGGRKALLEWSEPTQVRHTYYPYPLITKWAHIRCVLFFVLMVAIMIIFPEDDPTALWAMPLMGLIGGLLGGYVIPLLDYRAESTITISHEGVQRSDSILVLSVPILYLTGFRQRRWTWSQIAFCQIAWAEPQGKRLRLLELFTNSGERLGLVGVPDGIEDGTVVACLKAHGCEVRGL